MSIDWASLGLVAVVSLASAVAVVVLVSLALVGLSARAPERAGGPDDGAPALSPATGTAVAVVCLLATVAIVVYALLIIVG